MSTVSRQTRNALVEALSERYARASKEEKGKILSEFAAVSGYPPRKSTVTINEELRTKGGES